MSSVSTLTVTEQDHDPILEGLQEELIEAAEQGPEAVERTLAAWCDRYPDRADAFRNEARAILLLWGLREPERLGQYQLLDVLTTGGMGKLYRAREDVTGRIVVVKTILAGHLSPPRQVERFETERRLLSRLHDTHIVPLLATGREGYLLYLVMPFIPGVTLRSMILSLAGRDPGAERLPTFDALFAAASKVESRKRMDATRAPAAVPDPAEPAAASATDPAPPGRDRRPADYFRRVAAMMEHVALAVHHIHDARIVHRDLKPSNIMIESSGHSWVIDIGLGRELDRAEDDGLAAIPSPGRTDNGMTQGIGTLAYMAPEQLGPPCGPAGPTGPTRHDARTDVWGLGATLYELLTLRLPFPGRTAEEVARKIVAEPPARLNGGIPRELRAICLKALEKEPAERYASASELAADLRRWLDRRPSLAGESAIRRKAGLVAGESWIGLRRFGFWSRRHPAAAFAAGLFTALLFVGALGAKAQLDAARRELEIFELLRLRNPSRQMGWFPKSWQHIRALRGGGQTADPTLQGQAAATLEGIDARIVKTLPGTAKQVEFDVRSERLLIFQQGGEEHGKPWFRTTLWDRATDKMIVDRDLGRGVVAFRTDGTPLQASLHPDDPARLRLYDVTSGRELHAFRSPLEGLSAFRAMTFSRDGSHVAAVSRLVRKEGNRLVDAGDSATITVWDVASGSREKTLDHRRTEDVVLSPDGRLMAAWDNEGEIVVWTLPDGKERSRFRVGRSPVYCLAFGRDPFWHEDGSVPQGLLAVGESTGLITIWDLGSGRPRSICRGSKYEVRSLDFSADGAMLVSAGRNPAKLWDVANGVCLLDIGLGNVLHAIAFAPDGRHLAISRGPEFGDKSGVEVLELELGRGTRTLYGLQGSVERTIFSPDGRLVAGVTHEWQVGIWDRPSGHLRGVLAVPVGRSADNFGMAFDTGGQRFACSVGHQARLWDLEARRTIGQWDLPEGLSDSLAFRGRDQLLLIRQETRNRLGGPFSQYDPREYPRTVRIYDLLGPTPTKAIKEISDFDWYIGGIAVTSDGSHFVVDGTGSDKGRLVRRFHVYDGPTGELRRALPIRSRREHACYSRFDPNGKVLGARLDYASGQVRLFDLPTLTDRGSVDWPVDCLSPGATRWLAVIYGADNQPLQHALYDLEHAEPLLQIVRDVHPGGFNCHCFSPDGRYVMTGSGDGTISICDLVEINRRLSELRLGW